MDWTPILLLGFIIFMFLVFLTLWFTGAFTTPVQVIVPTDTSAIQKQIDIIMPPSVWSNPVTKGACSIYNFPIEGEVFPFVTNATDVIAGLKSVINNRCYFSNELALVATTRTCGAAQCLDDFGNAYEKGQEWGYYNLCGTSCYSEGQMLSIITLSMGASSYPTVAVSLNVADGSSVNMITPNIGDSNQYHIVKRYTSSTLGRVDPTGHMCNIIHRVTGKYLTAKLVEVGSDSYYTLTYIDKVPTKTLWLLAAPTSLAGVAQSQRLVFLGNNDIKIARNPSLVEYDTYVQQYGLLAVVYGLNINVEVPFVGVFLAPALNADLTYYSFDTQIIDISRFSLMLTAPTGLYPFYRWSKFGITL